MTKNERDELIPVLRYLNTKVSAPSRALEELLGQFGQAWSPMAQRNLLSDILRELLKLQKDPKLVVPPGDKNDVDVFLNLISYFKTVLGKHAPTTRRYITAICLGYKYKTGSDHYSGKTDDRADMLKRCSDMKKAIRAAYRLADVVGTHNADRNMLKIFMAPEFFFRGRNGAYDHELVHGNQGQKGLMEILAEETDLPQYADYLFVLGTAILASKSTKTVCTLCGKEPTFVKDPVTNKTKPECITDPGHKTFKETHLRARVENVAFVRKEGESYLVTKQLVSDIDYVQDRVRVRGERLEVERRAVPSGYKKADPGRPKFTDERMGGTIFTIDGVTFGLEVCLDHAATTTSGTRGRLKHAANIQIQLVPSAGMEINTVRTVAGGFAFNVDGLTPHVQVKLKDINQPLQSSGLSRAGLGSRAWASIQRSVGVTVGQPRLSGSASGTVISFGPYDIPIV